MFNRCAREAATVSITHNESATYRHRLRPVWHHPARWSLLRRQWSRLTWRKCKHAAIVNNKLTPRWPPPAVSVSCVCSSVRRSVCLSRQSIAAATCFVVVKVLLKKVTTTTTTTCVWFAAARTFYSSKVHRVLAGGMRETKLRNSRVD